MPPFISDKYLELQKTMHRKTGDYGRSGDKWLGHVLEIAQRIKAKTILDYGCGRGALTYALGVTEYEAKGYDPAIPAVADPPSPADLVVCTDVMEHVEADYVDKVINHLWTLTRQRLLVAISTRPAGKTLADGRNAHITLWPGKRWQREFKIWFEVVRGIRFDGDEWVAELLPREKRYE